MVELLTKRIHGSKGDFAVAFGKLSHHKTQGELNTTKDLKNYTERSCGWYAM